jgi:hypothetical protein
MLDTEETVSVSVALSVRVFLVLSVSVVEDGEMMTVWIADSVVIIVWISPGASVALRVLVTSVTSIAFSDTVVSTEISLDGMIFGALTVVVGSSVVSAGISLDVVSSITSLNVMAMLVLVMVKVVLLQLASSVVTAIESEDS